MITPPARRAIDYGTAGIAQRATEPSHSLGHRLTTFQTMLPLHLVMQSLEISEDTKLHLTVIGAENPRELS